MSTLFPITTTTSRPPLPSHPLTPAKRKTMSITQTYYLAHSARGKLSDEAGRSDHRLRRLVGHANLLDSLMLELAQAEAEQESWFNASVRRARTTERHVQWADSVVEEPEEDWHAEDAERYPTDSSDDSSDDDEDEEMHSAGFASLQRVKSRMTFESMDVVEEEEDDGEDDIYEDDGEEDYAMLTLSRTASHPHSPPELSLDLEEDDSSEDEAMPLSPPSDVLHTFPSPNSPQDKLLPTQQAALFDEGFYLLQRSGPSLVSAVSVY